jgi:hypothetical protein
MAEATATPATRPALDAGADPQEVAGWAGQVKAGRAAVVMVDGRVSGQFTEVVRGMCGYPAAVLSDPTQATVRRVVRRIAAAGRQPVLLATHRARLARYGTGIQHIMLLDTTQELGIMTHPPEAVNPLDFDVWMLEVAR